MISITILLRIPTVETVIKLVKLIAILVNFKLYNANMNELFKPFSVARVVYYGDNSKNNKRTIDYNKNGKLLLYYGIINIWL